MIHKKKNIQYFMQYYKDRIRIMVFLFLTEHRMFAILNRIGRKSLEVC